MTRSHGHNFQENHKIKEIHLTEKLAAAQVTADHTARAVAARAAHAAHSLPAVQATTSSAISEAVPMVREATDQTIRAVRHAEAQAAEAMSTPEGRKKIGKVALHVADQIIDEGSRPYTGGVPVYRYTKEAIIAVHESKKKAEKS